MPSVSSITKSRLDDIDGKRIVSVDVDGSGNIIYDRNNGSSLNAGSAVGLQGDPGPDGEITLADINSAIDDISPESWVELPLESDWISVPSFPTPKYRMIQDRVWLDGVITYTGSSTPGPVLVPVTTALSSAAVPTYNCCLGGIFDFRYFNDLRIYTDGILSIYITSGRTLDTVTGDFSLSGLNYPTS